MYSYWVGGLGGICLGPLVVRALDPQQKYLPEPKALIQYKDVVLPVLEIPLWR